MEEQRNLCYKEGLGQHLKNKGEFFNPRISISLLLASTYIASLKDQKVLYFQFLFCFPVCIIVSLLQLGNPSSSCYSVIKQEIHQIILSHFEEHSDLDNEVKEEKDEGQDDEMFMGLINKIKIQKFYINIRIIINDFLLDTMTLFDTGANSNCFLEGLIPTKLFQKTSEKLSAVSGSKLKIIYNLSSATIEDQGLRIETNFLLVQNLNNEVILGTPFIRSLFPLHISKEGITTWHLGRKITFDFSTKPIARNINFIEKKISQINFLKDEVSFSNIQIQLEKPQLRENIQSLLQHIQSTICSDLPHIFQNRKKHIIDLPYEKDFYEK